MEYEIKPLSSEEEEAICAKINAYAYTQAPPEPGTPQEERLIFKAADSGGRTVGGCIVNIHTWGRAVLASLWVDETCRGQGLGSMLIRTAERAAREKGCYYLCLGTVDFMARPLYEKHGFAVFTVNKNVPRGHDSWSLSKRLDRNTPDYVPANNSAATVYTITSGSEKDAEVILGGLDRYCRLYLPEGHDDIALSKKLVDRDGRMIAAIAAGVDGDDNAEIDAIWVDEKYRGKGLGTLLLGEIERAAHESGAYILLTYACDWVVGFFKENGYTVRGTLEDYPKGHCAYELQKLL